MDVTNESQHFGIENAYTDRDIFANYMDVGEHLSICRLFCIVKYLYRLSVPDFQQLRVG